MLNPHLLTSAAKTLNRMAGVAALKSRVLTQLAPLQSFLAARLGATVATMSVGVLAAAVAAAWWQKLNGCSESDMERAAAEAGAGQASRAIGEWVMNHL